MRIRMSEPAKLQVLCPKPAEVRPSLRQRRLPQRKLSVLAWLDWSHLLERYVTKIPQRQPRNQRWWPGLLVDAVHLPQPLLPKLGLAAAVLPRLLQLHPAVHLELQSGDSRDDRWLPNIAAAQPKGRQACSAGPPAEVPEVRYQQLPPAVRRRGTHRSGLRRQHHQVQAGKNFVSCSADDGPRQRNIRAAAQD